MDVKIKGLKKLTRRLKQLPKQTRLEMERELRAAAKQVCARARELCQDKLLAKQINYKVHRTNDEVRVEVIGPATTKDYLIQAFEELKPNFRGKVAQALRRAIKA
jgi:hypothetical protein